MEEIQKAAKDLVLAMQEESLARTNRREAQRKMTEIFREEGSGLAEKNLIRIEDQIFLLEFDVEDGKFLYLKEFQGGIFNL